MYPLLQKLQYISSEKGTFVSKEGKNIVYVSHRFISSDFDNVQVSDPVRGRDIDSLLNQFVKGQSYDLLISSFEQKARNSYKVSLVSATLTLK